MDMHVTTVNVQSYGSSLKCCVCVYNRARMLQAMRMQRTPENANGKLEETSKKTPDLLCNCKVQRYCSVAHLTEDLMEHRDFCQILREVQQVESISFPHFLQGVVLSRTMLNQAISQLKLILSVKLRRPLSLREKEIIGNPGYCVICYRTTPLNSCAGCEGVAYCSEYHRQLDKDNHTPKVCRTLALVYSPYRLLESNQFQIKEFHRSSILQETNLVEAFYNATLLMVNDSPNNLQQYDLLAACSSFSTVCTVCLALTHLTIVAEPDKAVIVYIVGATSECLRYFEEMHLKFFFLQYESVQNLELYFIGNMIEAQESEESIICVGDLKRKVLKRNVPGIGNMTPLLVGQFYPRSVQIEEPDDRYWPECLIKILQTYGAPICFTSLSKVLALSNYSVFNDLARENNIVIKRSYNITKNLYRGILPLRNHCAEDSEMIVYNNNYLEVMFTNPKN
ncbi:uncharacterized protein [Drosophila pseudoobscura]|uniref:Uncharacterized protein isoform X1 n=1 Tax=Drosophila pseudoobscura pseudoobscura TaxID=46245 RepID=A0A6I8USH8_DROPS|nr:uncharacterized protein LOC4803517 isoform X1 [Drosophila pseudoobscura]